MYNNSRDISFCLFSESLIIVGCTHSPQQERVRESTALSVDQMRCEGQRIMRLLEEPSILCPPSANQSTLVHGETRGGEMVYPPAGTYTSSDSLEGEE
jgi:hypothetical protein